MTLFAGVDIGLGISVGLAILIVVSASGRIIHGCISPPRCPCVLLQSRWHPISLPVVQVLESAFPHTAKLGQIPGTTVWRNVQQAGNLFAIACSRWNPTGPTGCPQHASCLVLISGVWSLHCTASAHACEKDENAAWPLAHQAPSD